MNSLNINGTVKSFGEKGTQYKKLWIAIETANSLSNSSTIFINFDLDSNPSSKKFKQGEFIKSKLEKGKQIFICDATIKPIKMSKPDGAGGWTTEEKTGVGANLSAIRFPTNPLPTNIVVMDGKITKHDDKKILIEQSYRLPANNEWKTRTVPVLIADDIHYMFKDVNLSGKDAFVYGEIVATDKAVFVLAKNLIAT